jgi:hypothetical protein
MEGLGSMKTKHGEIPEMGNRPIFDSDPKGVGGIINEF